MGVVLKQSRLNSYLISISFLLGGIYSIFIVPRLFDDSPELWGLIQLLIYYVQILSMFVLFSQPSVVMKYYPEYRKTANESQLLGFSLSITLMLFLVFTVLWFFFGRHLYFEDDPELYQSYHLILIPMLAGTLFFDFMGAYARIRQRSVLQFFLGNALQKLVFFVALGIMYFSGLSFEVLIILLLAIYLLKPVILWIDLKIGRLAPVFSFSEFRGLNKRKIFDYSAFGILGGVAYFLIMRVDSIMIGNMLGLDQLAYYSIPVFLISAIGIPEKAMVQISMPVISSLHADRNFKEIGILYQKVSVSQFVLGTLIFLAIWLNISLLMEVLGEKFGNTSWAFFILGAGKLVDLMTGVNGPILNVSEKYRYNLLLQIILMVLAIGLNIILIPRMGINGAALATAVSIIVYNALKTILVYRWFGIHPFSAALIRSIIFFLIVGALMTLLPIAPMYLEVLVKSLLFAVAAFLFIYLGGASSDLEKELKRILKKWFK